MDENVSDIKNPVFKTKADAYDTVWRYFGADGIAKDDEWFQDKSGLWYYFDDVVMVCGDFDHEIGNKVYGFDENGAMLVGWAKNVLDEGISAPNKNTKSYYYNTDGTKFDASHQVNGTAASVSYGWKKIDGE